jgi:ubiquinone/menaquinone biosynthesis C-methylase UbiE
VDIDRKLQLEHQWHESEDFARDDNSLIVGVYQSAVFREAESYHLDALGDVAGLHVLDYGCGTGGTTAQLAARGARVAGFDISLTRLAEARQRVAGAPGGGQAGLVQSVAEMLPFADSSFDAVLGKQILHHLDLTIAVPEIARVLRPGGRAVFLEPLIHNPILEDYRRLTPHLRSPTERALSMAQLAWIGGHFSAWSHREFILLSILPVLASVLTRRPGALAGWQQRLQHLDRALVDAVPWLDRYCWETVIVLER